MIATLILTVFIVGILRISGAWRDFCDGYMPDYLEDDKN